MRQWHVESVFTERLELRLMSVQESGGKVFQVLAASNPLNVYLIWYREMPNDEKSKIQ